MSEQVPTATGFVYVVMNEDGEPNVFINSEDADAYALAYHGELVAAEEQPLLTTENTRGMIEDLGRSNAHRVS